MKQITHHKSRGLARCSHMSLKCTARKFFFGTEMLGTIPTLGDSHSSNFACNIVSNGSNHAPPIGSVASDIGSIFSNRSVGALHPAVVSNLQPFIGSVASDIGSIFPERSMGALHPSVVSNLQPFIGSIASDIRSVFGAHFGCARPL